MFGMGTGGSSSLRSPRSRMTTLPRLGAAEYLTGFKHKTWKAAHDLCAVEFYGQAERAISNGKLNALLRLHIRPIKLVVFQCPS